MDVVAFAFTQVGSVCVINAKRALCCASDTPIGPHAASVLPSRAGPALSGAIARSLVDSDAARAQHRGSVTASALRLESPRTRPHADGELRYGHHNDVVELPVQRTQCVDKRGTPLHRDRLSHGHDE